jgi:hypothetical protein
MHRELGEGGCAPGHAHLFVQRASVRMLMGHAAFHPSANRPLRLCQLQTVSRAQRVEVSASGGA